LHLYLSFFFGLYFAATRSVTGGVADDSVIDSINAEIRSWLHLADQSTTVEECSNSLPAEPFTGSYIIERAYSDMKCFAHI
jgi:hypothetical protein